MNIRKIMLKLITLGSVCLFVCLSGATFAQKIGPVLQNEISFDFPGLKNREALVELEFTVQKDGSVSDIKEVGGFYSSRFLSTAINTAKKLKFSPAMSNGGEIDWPGYRVDFRFVLKDTFHTVRPAISNTYRDIENLMREENLIEAENLILNVLDDVELYYEYSLFNLKLSEILIANSRLLEASHVIRKATATYFPGEHDNFNTELARVRDTYVVSNVRSTSDSNFASTSMHNEQNLFQPQPVLQAVHTRGNLRSNSSRGFGASMEKRDLNVLNYGLLKSAYLQAFYVHTSLGQLKEQADDYNKMNNLSSSDVNEAMTSQIEQSEGFISSGQSIASNHFILDGESIFYPSRSIIAAINVEGEIDSVDFQCESRVYRLDFQEEVEWKVPSSWGDCGLRFRGESGATFSLVEFSE